MAALNRDGFADLFLSNMCTTVLVRSSPAADELLTCNRLTYDQLLRPFSALDSEGTYQIMFIYLKNHIFGPLFCSLLLLVWPV